MHGAFGGLRSRLLAIVLLALLPATALFVLYAAEQSRLSTVRARDEVRRLAESDAVSLQDLIGQARATLVAYSFSQPVMRADWKAAALAAERIRTSEPDYLNVGVADVTGRVVASAIPSTDTVEVGDRPYFRRVIQSARFAIGDYQVGRLSKRPSLNVANPVFDEHGRLVAVAFISLDVENMRSRISAIPHPGVLPEYLLDANGTVLVREPDAPGASGASMAGSELMGAILAQRTGSASVPATDGTITEYEFVPVFESADAGLYVAMGFSSDQLFATERWMLAVALEGIALVAAAALTVAWWAGTRWVLRPIRKLREAADRIGRGKLSARADLTSGIDEFTELGRRFDSMAESIERRADFNQALAQINRLVHSTLEFDEVMQRIISVTCDAVGAETAAILLRQDGKWHTKYSYNFDEDIIGVVLSDEQAPHAAAALRTGHPVAVDDAVSDSRVDHGVMASYGIRSVLTMPLIVHSEVVGVMFMNHHSHRVEFGQEQTDFAESVAATVALALQNARIYEGEHRIAETLQQSLLALPERIPHLRFANVYRSATEAARVGGDFYDLFEIEHGLVGIVIGDISGKGLDAAALTSLVKNTIRAQGTDPAKTPAQVMGLVNRLLLRESSPEMFATVFLGVLDTATGRLVYCNAGHTTAAIGCPGSLGRLVSNSTLVGALPDAVFDDSEALMQIGDLLFLYTDGLTEVRGDEGMLGEERVFALLEGLPGCDPSVAAARAIQEAGEYAGGRLSDDLAILVVTLTES